MRSLAREIVFQYQFTKLFNQNDGGLFDVLAKNLNADDRAFAEKLLKATETDKDKKFETIYKLSENFHANRIFSADKCALLIGISELDEFKETDVPVIIDEAVKLAVKFSTERSADYVNGILATYAKTARGQ